MRLLNESLKIFLDNELVDEIRISADLKGRVLTETIISGQGEGTTRENAARNALDHMSKLQSALAFKPYPIHLQIVD